jgi:hypothetical protein
LKTGLGEVVNIAEAHSSEVIGFHKCNGCSKVGINLT